PALAELWWHVGQAQARVDLLLGGAGQPFASGSVLARLPSGEEPVLVEVPSPIERELPKLDVVLLGAREVQDSGPEARLLHRPKVHLQAALQRYARLRSSLARHGSGLVVVLERVGHRPWLVRHRDDVDVPDALLPAPVRAGHLESAYARHGQEPLQEWHQNCVDVAKGQPADVAAVALDPAQHALGRLGTEALEFRELPRSCRRLEVLNRSHTERAPERGGLLRTYPLHACQLQQADGYAFLEFR